MTYKNVVRYSGYGNPAFSVAAVTPSNTTVISARALYIGGAGNVAVTALDGSTATFTSVPAGTILPVVVTKVMATGTTATNIVALY